MPVKKTGKKGCYKVANTTTKKCMTKKGAQKQQRAIYASKAKRSK